MIKHMIGSDTTCWNQT